MNREIKLRVFNTRTNEWHYVDIKQADDLFDDRWSSTHFDWLSQYTGLKDKNGKEIFEGDIVKRTTFTRDGEEQEEETSIGEVVYGAPSYGMELAKYKDWVEPLTDGEFQETGYDGMGREVDFKYEVIGNVFENPNLLKESK